PYELRVVYTPVADPYEPNQPRELATPIEVGEPVTAYCFTGLELWQLDFPDFDDWYTLDLAVGHVSVTVRNVPDNIRMSFTVLDGSDNEVTATGNASSILGGDIDGAFDVDKPGTYRLQLALAD